MMSNKPTLKIGGREFILTISPIVDIYRQNGNYGIIAEHGSVKSEVSQDALISRKDNGLPPYQFRCVEDNNSYEILLTVREHTKNAAKCGRTEIKPGSSRRIKSSTTITLGATEVEVSIPDN